MDSCGSGSALTRSTITLFDKAFIGEARRGKRRFHRRGLRRIELPSSLRSAMRFRLGGSGYIIALLAVEAPDGFLWFWIGAHAEYDHIIP
jgi:hypothetical protein